MYTYKYIDGRGAETRPVDWNITPDLRSFPAPVRTDFGHALFTAQEGKTDPAAKPGNTWRAVYTVRFQDAIYVLHVFQKKSTKGIATPAREIELIKRRLAEAGRDYRERQN